MFAYYPQLADQVASSGECQYLLTLSSRRCVCVCYWSVVPEAQLWEQGINGAEGKQSKKKKEGNGFMLLIYSLNERVKAVNYYNGVIQVSRVLNKYSC